MQSLSSSAMISTPASNSKQTFYMSGKHIIVWWIIRGHIKFLTACCCISRSHRTRNPPLTAPTPAPMAAPFSTSHSYGFLLYFFSFLHRDTLSMPMILAAWVLLPSTLLSIERIYSRSFSSRLLFGSAT